MLCLISWGCKESKNDASVKTLDNIASGKITYYACEGEAGAYIHPNAQAQLAAYPHLQRAIKAVPKKVQIGFFDDFKGSIQITPQFTANDCPGINRQREDDLLGCWQRLPNDANSIKILLRKNATNKEQYALVRVFGFVYGDLLTRRVVNGSTVQFAAVTPNLVFYRHSLASTFLGELSQISKGADHTTAEQMLTQLGIQPPIFNNLQADDRRTQYVALADSVKENFSSRVFGEAFHSRFCTDEAFRKACEMFHETMKQFKPYADDANGANTANCPDTGKMLSAGSNSSSTHTEYFRMMDPQLASRKQANLDNGAQANAQIAIAAGTQGMHLGGIDFQSISSLLSGGASGQGSGNPFMAFLQMLLYTGPGFLPGYTPIPSYYPPGYIPTPMIPGFSPQPNTGNATAEEVAAFNATNSYRQQKGLTALQFDNQLLTECRTQAQLQVQNGLTHWIQGQGTSTAENIAYGQETGARVAQTWIDSPGHNANIVAQHTYMAVGGYSGGGTMQWCQRFR